MANYQGIDCPICKKPFLSDDDIVVCPDCGAPQHRDCYKKLGHCANIPSHTKDILSAPIGSDKIKVCRRCGTVNPSENKNCAICSESLDIAQSKPVADSSDESNEGYADGNPTQPPLKFSDIPRISFPDPELKINGESLSDINQFIGVNSIYYISKMKLNANSNNFLSWNWSAFFLTYIYFFYRKMYKAGIAFFLLIAISFVPTLMIAKEFLMQAFANPILLQTFNFDMTGLENLLMFSRFTSNIPFIVAIVSGLKANSLYCSHVFIKLHNLHSSTSSRSEFTSEVFRKGGVSVSMALAIGIFAIALYFGAISLMATNLIS